MQDLGLNDFERDALKQKEEEKKAHRSVHFGDQILDPLNIDYTDLDKKLQDELPTAVTNMTLGRIAEMEEYSGKKFKKPSSRKSGKYTKTGGVKRLPPEKTELIGFLGECEVFHWLVKRFPKKDIEKSWVSTNRQRLFCEEGNDSLGYDFRLDYKRQRWFLEVKSSLQDPMEFAMGETEVEKAKTCATKAGDEYRIIYVSDVEDPQRIEISILPNPFSEEGKLVFSRPREKFRYRFSLT